MSQSGPITTPFSVGPPLGSGVQSVGRGGPRVGGVGRRGGVVAWVGGGGGCEGGGVV